MDYRSIGYSILLITIVLNISMPVQAQSKPAEDQKRKEFGYTLKLPKQDPQKNTGITGKKQEDPDDIVRVETLLISCDVQVVDKQGRAVSGLNKNDFIVAEDDAPQEVTTFALGDDPNKPRSIILIIDHSSSQLPYLEASVDAAKMLVDKLGQKDKMAIVTDDVLLLIDFTRDKAKLKEKLESLKRTQDGRFGVSMQFSALLATLKELVDKNERTLIIFQTDGDELRRFLPSPSGKRLPHGDGVAEYTVADIYKEAETSGATIYAVIPGFRFAGLSGSEQLSQIKKDISMRERSGAKPKELYKYLSKKDISNEELLDYAKGPLQLQLAMGVLAANTGGEASFLEEPKDAAEIYSRILSDIDHRYVIGYQPTNTERDGKRRRINIEVRSHPEYVIKGRRSYYAPSADR